MPPFQYPFGDTVPHNLDSGYQHHEGRRGKMRNPAHLVNSWYEKCFDIEGGGRHPFPLSQSINSITLK
jgi:hypothetical protein